MWDDENRPGHLARRFQQIAVGVFHAEVSAAGFDLTPVQYAALRTIGTRPGLDQATLAQLIAFDRTTIGGVVDRLVQKGLATRETSPTDRRARVLHVTERGQSVLAGIEPSVEAAQRSMLRGLSEEEATVFLRLFRKAVLACNDLSRAPARDSTGGRGESGPLP